MHWPRTARPLGPPLCHPSSTEECERWLKSLILVFQHLFRPFMFPRTASGRFPTKASRSFFTTLEVGKTLCGIQSSVWTLLYVLVIDTGTNCLIVASCPAMLPLVVKSLNICCQGAATLLRPVLPAPISRAEIPGCLRQKLCLISGLNGISFEPACILSLKSFARNNGTSMYRCWNKRPG